MNGLNLETYQEYEVIPVGPSGGTKIECPKCSRIYHMRLTNGKLNKQLRASCTCGEKWNVIFCTRSWYRKKVSLPGSWIDGFGKEHGMIVEDLSRTGISFLSSSNVNLNKGDRIKVSFALNNGNLIWIHEWMLVKRTEDRKVAAEFIILSIHNQKIIGFYLMN